MYNLISQDYLMHYGVKGMKWGVRHDPERVGRKKTKSTQSKSNNKSRNNSKKSVGKKSVEKTLKKNANKKINTGRSIKDIQRQLGIPEEEAKYLKKVAIGLGVAVGTTAGLYLLAACVGGKKIKTQSFNPNYTDINKNPFTWTSQPIEDVIHNRLNGDYIGALAKDHGYGPIDSDFIKNSINNTVNNGRRDDSFYSDLVKNVRQNQIDLGAGRRLSCWSAAQSYFLSSMTNDQYACKSFQNMVDFNDFGSIYKKAPDIFSLSGEKVSDFCGKFGSKTPRATPQDAMSLIGNIFKNIDISNNLTPDKSRTIGFINASYYGYKCQHEWNFEIIDGIKKTLVMVDGWAGERYKVAECDSSNKISYIGDGFKKLVGELNHYNRDSIRFYAPSLNSLNLDTMSKIILGKKN